MISIGIMGSGDIVRTMLNYFTNDKDYCCKAIYCRETSKNRALALQEEFNIATVYTSMDNFLNDTSFDVVYVAVLNSYHYDYTKQALLASKNVICEKPFCNDLNKATELFQIAQTKGLFVYELKRNIFTKSFETVQQNLNKLGKIRVVNCAICHHSRKYDEYLNKQVAGVFDPKYSGGALYDLGVYAVNFMVALFGHCKGYSYSKVCGFNGIDISGVLTLRYDGFIVNIVLSKATNGPSTFSIQGELGFIHSQDSIMFLKQITMTTNDGINEQLIDNQDIYFEEINNLKHMILNKNLDFFNDHKRITLISTEILQNSMKGSICV